MRLYEGCGTLRALQLLAGRLHAHTCLHLQQPCRALRQRFALHLVLQIQRQRMCSAPSRVPGVYSLYSNISLASSAECSDSTGPYQDDASAAVLVCGHCMRSPPALLDKHGGFQLSCSCTAHEDPPPLALDAPGGPVLPS